MQYATKTAMVEALAHILSTVVEGLDTLDETPALATILEPHIEAQFDGCPCGMSQGEHVAIMRAKLLSYAAMVVLSSEFEDTALMHGSRAFLTAADAVHSDITHTALLIEEQFGESSRLIAEEALSEAIGKE